MLAAKSESNQWKLEQPVRSSSAAAPPQKDCGLRMEVQILRLRYIQRLILRHSPAPAGSYKGSRAQ